MLIMLTELLLDIKIIIASVSIKTWYILYQYDNEFKHYACSYEGIRNFIRLFATEEIGNSMKISRIFGKIHSIDDLPAITDTITGNQVWYYDDKIHRKKYPAYIEYDFNNNIIKEEWYSHGMRHRDGGLPAQIRYNNDGTLFKVWWFNDRRQWVSEIVDTNFHVPIIFMGVIIVLTIMRIMIF